MKNSISSNSFLSQNMLQQQTQQNFQKNPQQFKALFLKNLKLQSKQMGTNLCQILTPILCILFTFLMKKVAEDNMNVGAIFEPIYYPIKFSNYSLFDQKNPQLRQPLQWLIYQCIQKCDKQYLGSNDGQTQKTGLLGSIPLNYQQPIPYIINPFIDLNQTIQKTVPFFIQNNQTSNNKQLINRLYKMNDKFSYIIDHKKQTITYLPDGTYTFKQTSDDKLTIQLKINDVRQLLFHNKNGLTRIQQYKQIIGQKYLVPVKQYNIPIGLLNIMDFPLSAYITKLTNKTIQSGYWYMPQDDSGVTFVDTVISFVAVLVFPISLSLLFPVFLYTIVLEKQEKLIQMMKMNGMKISSYWLVYFVFNFILAMITNIIFVAMGYFLTGMRFFTESSFLLLAIVLIGWSLAQIGLAVFFQTFLNKSRSANIIGYLLSIWMSMIASTLSIAAYQYPKPYPMGLRMFGPFGFCRIMYLMIMSCSQARCYSNLGDLPEEMKHQIAFLYLNFIFFFLLGSYLFEIIPQEFGVTRNPLFPFKSIKKYLKKMGSSDQKNSQQEISQDPQYRKYINKSQEDEFSKKQRSDILAQQGIIQSCPLVINNLRKLYKKQGRQGMYPAVRSFNLKVGPRQTFGLLGPNGAGKTTLISMITGMFQPNFGNAWIGGYDIKDNIANAQLEMGVCPQFDLLWPQLTVQQHLYFYARLKGVPSKSIKQRVQMSLKQVKLTKFKDLQSSALSGGMKRRLSVAISLVGSPKIVFLDQPSTGLDPDNRRQLWQVLAKCQKRRAIFITTHMMQQADTLCNRIGILTSGVLRTVGPQTTLKKNYGGGYRLTMSTTKQQKRLIDRTSLNQLQNAPKIQDYDENYDAMQDQHLKRSIDSFIHVQQKQNTIKNKKRTQNLTNFMHNKFHGSVLTKQFNGYLMFKVPLTYKVSQIFQIMQKVQQELDISDVAVTNSSLQDVFMNVVQRFQVNAIKGNEFDENQQNIILSNNQAQQNVAKNKQESDSFVSFPNRQSIKVNNSQDKFGSVMSKKRSSVMSEENIKGLKKNQQQNNKSQHSHDDSQGEYDDN